MVSRSSIVTSCRHGGREGGMGEAQESGGEGRRARKEEGGTCTQKVLDNIT